MTIIMKKLYVHIVINNSLKELVFKKNEQQKKKQKKRAFLCLFFFSSFIAIQYKSFKFNQNSEKKQNNKLQTKTKTF